MSYSVSMIRVSGRATQYWQTLGPVARVYHILRCYAEVSRHMKIQFARTNGRVRDNCRAIAATLAVILLATGVIAARSSGQSAASGKPAAERAIYHQLFQCRVEFAAEFQGIVIHARDLDRANPRADPSLAVHARNLLDTVMEPGVRSLTQEVAQCILLLLPSGRASMGPSGRRSLPSPRP